MAVFVHSHNHAQRDHKGHDSPDKSAKGTTPPPKTAPSQPTRSPYLTLLIALFALPLGAALLGFLILWILG